VSLFTSTEIILAVMVVTYIIARTLKVSTELSMFAAALTGALAGGAGIPARHIVEGAFTYLDIVLIFITATLFMNILKESGGVAYVVRGILRKFYRRKSILLILITLLLLLPGALTGAGSVTVLITGGMIAIVLSYMGISKPRTAAIIFTLAGLSAAAPPVTMMFMASALVSLLLSPIKLNFLKISRDTVHQLLPLIGTLTCVGILVQIMTLTGVRGLIAITVVTLPLIWVLLSLSFVLPFSEAVLMWGAAPVLGVPLVLLFNTIGLNPIIALAGMSVIWPLGDALPPTAIIGRLTAQTVGMKEPYSRLLKHCIIPAIIIMAVGTLMVVFSKKLAFLTLL